MQSEWEVVDDDGFIYKRRKRKIVPPSPSTLVESPRPMLSEQAEQRAKEALARQKTMTMLLAQKEKYVAEIRKWEKLLTKPEETPAPDPVPDSPASTPEQPAGSLFSSEKWKFNQDLELFELQIEAYERFIEQLKRLLDQAERLCTELEKDVERDRIRLEQDLLREEEVMRRTPRMLLHALTSQSVVALPVDDFAAKSELGRLLAD